MARQLALAIEAHLTPRLNAAVHVHMRRMVCLASTSSCRRARTRPTRWTACNASCERVTLAGQRRVMKLSPRPAAGIKRCWSGRRSRLERTSDWRNQLATPNRRS
jgi:hypothetical protein